METTQMLYLAGAFVLGFIVAWFAGRGGPKRSLEECEANAHSLQRSLDDRSRSVSKLEAQLKEQTAQVDRLGSAQSTLTTSLQSAEQSAADAAAEIAALQTQLGQAQSDKLLLETELGHVRDAYAGTRTRLADLVAQSETQAADAAAAAGAEAENTALAVAEAGRAADVERLTAQVQSLEVELEAVRANSARLAGQVALRPQLSSTRQQEYAALAGSPERVVAALHERDMAVADARAEADYLRRTVGMLTGMGAELASEVERRRREQQVLLYQVAGLNAATRESEMRQLVDRQAQPVRAETPAAELPTAELPTETPAGTIEPEGHDLPVSTRPDNGLEAESQAAGDTDAASAATALALDLRSQLEERSKELEELRAQSDPLQANLDELQAEIEALNAANADLEAQLEARDGNLQELQNTLADLQANAESAAAAKAAIEEKLQLHGVAWSSLIARVKTLNDEIGSIVAAEPDADAEATGAEAEAPSDELAALAATAPVEQAVPEAARAADAVPAATATEPATEQAGEQAGESAEGDAVLNKLAAGVAAAVALFQRKNAKLAEVEEQINSLNAELNADKSALEATVAAKASLETDLDTRSSELSELQTRFAGLQTDAESAAAAKAALAEKLQLHGGAWNGLLERIGQLNVDLDSLIAAEPVASEPAETAEAPITTESTATAAASEAAAADAAPAAEAEAQAEADADAGEAAAPEDEEVAGARTAVAKLAAGVTAALAIVQRKNAQLAGFEQQVGALSGEKSTLESTLAAKDQSLVAAQAQVEQLQTGISQRSMRFDALSMHASSMEADMEINKLERAKLEEQVRTVAAGLQALLAPQTDADASADATGEGAVAEGAEGAVATADTAQPATAQLVTQSSLEELAAAATAVAGLVRSKDDALLDARTQLTGLQTQLADYESARQALAAELESRGVSMADVETRLQSLQSEYSGAQSAQGELQATLKTLGEELDAYLAAYGEADSVPEAGASDAAVVAADAVAADASGEGQPTGAPARAVAAVGAIGVLLQRRKDALEGANARIGELEAEISALTSQKSELDTQAEQQEQALADLTEQLAAAQAEAEARGADLAARTTDAETLQNQLSALQAQADATEQERVRLDAQWRSLNDDLAQFGAALDADDDSAVESLSSAMAQRLGAPVTPAAGTEAGAEADRSLAAPLVKTAGALTLAGVARKKLLALKATSAELATLQQEHAALLDRKSELEAQLQQESAALEQTKTQLAAVEAELAEARAQHMEELQLLDAKSAELQSQYNDAEASRLQLEGSLASLNQELDQLGAVLESDDDEGLLQFAQRTAAAPSIEAEAPTAAGEGSGEGSGAVKVVGVAAVAAALQRKQAALKEADARAAAMQAQLDELSADREAAKTLLADRDQALQEVESKLTEVTLQAEKTVSDFKAAARAAAEARGVEVQTTNVLQDFAELKHIGVTFEQRLYRAGAGTFWEVAHLTDEDFALILRLTEMQQLAMNLDETRNDAVRLAEETGTLGMISAGERPDDFEPIQGIGKVFEQRLYSAGIRTYWDLANTSEERLAEICKARRPLVPDYASWIRQARILAEVRSDN